MTPKDARSWRVAGLLIVVTLGLGIALDQLIISRPMIEEKGAGQESNPPGPPAVGASAPAPFTPLGFLLEHRRRRTSSTQAMPNAPIDINQPAQAMATEMPPITDTPGAPNQVGDSVPKSMATEKGPPGIPIPAENLGRDSEALRNDSPPATPNSPR